MKALTWEQAVRVVNEREQQRAPQVTGSGTREKRVRAQRNVTDDKARGQRSRDLTGSDGRRDLEPDNHGRNVRATRPVTQVSKQIATARRKVETVTAYLACSGCGARVAKTATGGTETQRDNGGRIGWAHTRPVRQWHHWDGTALCQGAETVRVQSDVTPDRTDLTPAPAVRTTRAARPASGRTADAEKAFRRSLTPEQRRQLDADERAFRVAERNRQRGAGIAVAGDQAARRDMGAGAQ
ncbi:hypothetical protein KGQ19_26885 [Catenulispora sp. NL8]|uniref:Uncharacterized protein n=1 Tax=Catenulispora pinistramenti TaxID=2705254 RepID=A0ABS5KWU8_9ACTN|nr:hypothetical protein [Catenulispora pinistramenti]MBS2550502.1 hypothetical protein [Catenulispora pinistramenti]